MISLSSYDIATITVLQKELTAPSITPTYRKELENRLTFLRNTHPPKTESNLNELP
jgi:hypothetical protein